MVVAYTAKSKHAARNHAGQLDDDPPARRRRNRAHRPEPRAGRLSHAADVPARRALLQETRAGGVAARARARAQHPPERRRARRAARRGRAGLHLRLPVGRRVERIPLSSRCRRRSTSATPQRAAEYARVSVQVRGAVARHDDDGARASRFSTGDGPARAPHPARAERFLAYLSSPAVVAAAARRARRHARPVRSSSAPAPRPSSAVAPVDLAYSNRRRAAARRPRVSRGASTSVVVAVVVVAVSCCSSLGPVAGLVVGRRRARRREPRRRLASCAQSLLLTARHRDDRHVARHRSAERRSRTCSRDARFRGTRRRLAR